MRDASYANFPQMKPHIVSTHILHNLKPPYLQDRMKDIIQWRNDEQIEKKDFDVFIREVFKREKQLQQERGPCHAGAIPIIISDSETRNERVDVFKTRKRANRRDLTKTTQKQSNTSKE